MADLPVDEQQIFEAARQIDELEERARFVTQACGADLQILMRIRERLLEDDQKRASQIDGRTLDSPIDKGIDVDATRDSPFSSDAEQGSSYTVEQGTVIAGRYKLLENIGEGGMGSVWVAQQSQPVKRKVAIKLIKAGMDSRQVLARFDAERQALAMMEHENIAKVFDGGLTDQGRPYFAMEYVKGVPLTEYCDKAKLSVKQRLELFVVICQAIQHAHQKGIVHRDLKPTNILVGNYGGKSIPKVIDFGLAKAIHQPLTDQSLYTAHGMVIGTPMYMSPEQAESDNLDIDTRADIYSLGVLLYELLTGTTPFEKKQFKEAAIGEMLRIIRDVDPPSPSMRLSTSESLPSAAAVRSVTPVQLKRDLAGDLDWVVMKALEKERGRRYETANGFAADILRHLNDEPVMASPPSKTYRMKKFIKRNRVAVTAASLVGMALFFGVVGTSIGMYWAIRESKRADGETKLALTAKGDAVQSQEKAEKRLALAMDAIETFHTGVTDEVMLERPELEALRLNLLNSAMNFYELLKQDLVDAKDIPQKVAFADAIQSLAKLSGEVGSKEDSISAWIETVGVYEELTSADPDSTEFQQGLAASHSNLGREYFFTGKIPEATKFYQSSIELNERLIASNPDKPELKELQSRTYHALATLNLNQNDIKEARKNLETAEKICAELVVADPHNKDYQFGKAMNYVTLADLCTTKSELVAAGKYSRNAIEILDPLVDANPENTKYIIGLAACHQNLAFIQMGSLFGSSTRAMKSLIRAEQLLDQAVEHQPNNYRIRSQMAHAFSLMASIYMNKRDLIGAEKYARKTISGCQMVLENNPDNMGVVLMLGQEQANLGGLLAGQNRTPLALECFDQAVGHLRNVLDHEPRNKRARDRENVAVLGRAQVLEATKDYARSAVDWQRSAKSATGAQRSQYLWRQARCLALVDKYVEAAEIAGKPGIVPYWASGVFAICVQSVQSDETRSAESRDELARQYAAQAIQCLTKAEEKRWFRVGGQRFNFTWDPDLDGIRDLDEFKTIESRIMGDEKITEKMPPIALNNAAWELLTGIETEPRHTQMALLFATEACAKEEKVSRNENTLWRYLDTLALAQLKSEKLQDALNTQKRAIDLMPESEPVESRDEMNARLEEIQQAIKLSREE